MNDASKPELGALAADIREHGLEHRITLTHDERVLVDGRNRYLACELAGIEAEADVLPEWYDEQKIADFIVSMNVQRRHLTLEERAFIANRYKDSYSQAARERMLSAKPSDPGREGRADDQAGAQFDVSGKSVERAGKIEDYAPDLKPEVLSGNMSLSAAAREADERRRAAAALAAADKPSPVMLTLRTHTGEEVKYPEPKSAVTFNETTGEGISWAAWSWNPVTGCLHGCDYCYARAIAWRFHQDGAVGYPAGDDGFTPLFHEERLPAPGNTRIPAAYRDEMHVSCGRGDCAVCAYRRVFVCSMADLYGRWVPDDWVSAVHEAELSNPQWEYLHLTKFPARYNSPGLKLPENGWIGTSVDEQKRVRIAEDAFRQIEGVKVKWLSLEPLREPLEFSDLSMFDWVVIGAQTQTNQPTGVVPAFAPPFDWVARLYYQAKEAGCKVHFKPNLLGAVSPKSPGMQLPDEYPV